MESQSPRKKGIDWTNPPAPYETPPARSRLRRPLLLTGIAGGVAAGLVVAAVLSFNGMIGNEMADADTVVVTEAEAAPAKETAAAQEPTTGRLARSAEKSDDAELAPLSANDPRWGKGSPPPDTEDVAAVTAHAEASGMENAYAQRQRPKPGNFDRRSTASIEQPEERPEVQVAETEEEVQALEAIEGESEAEASEITSEAEEPGGSPPEQQSVIAEQPAPELQAEEPQAEEPQAEEPSERIAEEEPQQQVAALPPSARPSGPLVPATTTDGVNLRSGPSNRASIVAILIANLPVQASQNCPTWCEVVVNGRRGYVYKNFIRYGQGGAAQAKPAATTRTEQQQQSQAAQTEARQPAAQAQPPVADPLQRSRTIR